MTDDDKLFSLPREQAAITKFLSERRSNLAKFMTDPGPSRAQLGSLLTIAARVPDHRKLAPWRFIVFEGKSREVFGTHIAEVFSAAHPSAPSDKVGFERQRLMRAPTVVSVVSSPAECPRGTPQWEQVLSAGAVCHTLLLAAQSAGFAAQWLTEWISYDARINEIMGLKTGEKLAGFIYIGSTAAPSRPRQRPDMSEIVRYW